MSRPWVEEGHCVFVQHPPQQALIPVLDQICDRLLIIPAMPSARGKYSIHLLDRSKAAADQICIFIRGYHHGMLGITGDFQNTYSTAHQASFWTKMIEKYLPVGESHQTHREKLTKQRGSLLIKGNLMKKPHNITKSITVLCPNRKCKTLEIDALNTVVFHAGIH